MGGKGGQQAVQEVRRQLIDAGGRGPSAARGKLATEAVRTLWVVAGGAHTDEQTAVRVGDERGMGQVRLLPGDAVGKHSHHPPGPGGRREQVDVTRSERPAGCQFLCPGHVPVMAFAQSGQQGGLPGKLERVGKPTQFAVQVGGRHVQVGLGAAVAVVVEQLTEFAQDARVPGGQTARLGEGGRCLVEIIAIGADERPRAEPAGEQAVNNQAGAGVRGGIDEAVSAPETGSSPL